MKFTVSSTLLSNALQTASKVITGRCALPILDNFLLTLKSDHLIITSSDSETTMKLKIEVNEVIEEGAIAVDTTLYEVIKDFPEQPVEIQSNSDRNIIEVRWITGYSEIPFTNANEFPALPELKNDIKGMNIRADILLESISATQYAAMSDDSKAPVLSGVYFDIEPDMTTFVATDSHKLAFCTRHDIKAEEKMSFILPKKPCNVLKAMLPKTDTNVNIRFDNTNIYFEYDDVTLVSRLIEGAYPMYRSIIPKKNNNVVTVNRTDLLYPLRRVSVCSNKGNNCIHFGLSLNQINISAKDLELSLSASEDIKCQYDGDPMTVGFKSVDLIDILANMPYEEICLKLYDATSAALISAAYPAGENESEIVALLMPVVLR